MTSLLLTHLVLGAAILAFGRRVPKLAALGGVGLLLTTFVVTVVLARRDVPAHETWTWVEGLGLSIDLRLDGFGATMALVVSGLGALIAAFSVAYFDHDETFVRFLGAFVLFAGAMTGLVLSADLFTMFVFWEATSVLSFLLIGLDDRSENARRAALRALLTTGLGGLALLGAVALFQVSIGTSSFVELASARPSSGLVDVALVLVLVAAFTKSAQFPFHFWLPGAMAAPTPVSAFLHSATMVKAGVVLVARLAPVFGGREFWQWSIVVCGGMTMLIGGVRALLSNDAKTILAHGTVSQLGLLMILFGSGVPALTYAGVAHLVAHAIFKAGLFLGVGLVDHTFGTRDVSVLSGVGRRHPWMAVLVGANALSMAGVIPLLGFATKEKVLASLIDADGRTGGVGTVSLVVVIVGSVLTVVYTVRFLVGCFGRRSERPPTEVVHSASPLLVMPVAVSAGVSVMVGLKPSFLGDLLRAPAESLDRLATGGLVLWPGFDTAVATSFVILAVGGVIGWVTRDRRSSRPRPSAGEDAFDLVYDAALTLSRRVTAISQTGSLVVYLVVTMAVVLAALVAGIVSGGTWAIDGLVLADSWPQAAVAVCVCVGSVAVVVVRHRFVSAAILGAVGFGVAILFALHGAPDLAVTQLLVETLTLVVFLLVLRQMPKRFDPAPSWAPRAFRLAVSIAIGVTAAWFALKVFDARTAPSVGDDYTALADSQAGGRNVVNVTLVDFRGFDTLGEITVLAVAAFGVVNLVRMSQRRRNRNGITEGTAT